MLLPNSLISFGQHINTLALLQDDMFDVQTIDEINPCVWNLINQGLFRRFGDGRVMYHCYPPRSPQSQRHRQENSK